MKKIWISAILLSLGACLAGYYLMATPGLGTEKSATRLHDLNDSAFVIGVPMGGKATKLSEEQFPKARKAYFNSPRTGCEAVVQRSVDAFLFNSHTLDFIASRDEKLTVLPGVGERVDIAIAFAPEHQELCNEVNKFIAQFRKDGTYQQMYDRWFKSTERPDIPEIHRPDAPTRTIRVGVCSQVPPLCFRSRDEDSLSGFDIELLRRLSNKLNARIELHDMDFVTLFEALDEGRIDMGLAGLNKDTNRPDQVLYSDNYIDSYIVAIVHTSLVETPEKGGK